MGVFTRALDALLDVYGNLDLFRLVTYDAGTCSKANAQYIRDNHLHYLLGLKGSQPDLLFWASLWLNERAPESADAISMDGNGLNQVRRTIFLASCPDGTDGWDHLRTVIRVDSDGFDRHGRPTHETFYFLSSLPPDRLSPQQWLTVIRRHWAVETTHQILDGAFQEDDRPWVSHSPRLTTVIMILRRIGYTLLAVFKHVTQRSEPRRSEPWHVLLSRVRDAMLLATDAIVEGLRKRKRSAEPLPNLP
jgi:predicted transposase YbfD/YdcC